MIHLDATAYSSVNGGEVSYKIKANGVQIGSTLSHFFNTADDHRSISGTWVESVGPGNIVITVHMVRTQGVGNISLNTDDMICLTVFG